MDWKALSKPKKSLGIINLILLVVLTISLVSNQVAINKTSDRLGIKSSSLNKITSVFSGFKSSGSGNVALAGNAIEDAIKLAISQGVPEIYGEELGISFDQVQESINVVKQFDPTYGKQKIVLAGDDLQRYIDVGLRISCEYCCGAKSIIRADGQGACGCAHSWAMRGLIAYLVQNHGSEYTNDEILREVARWKAMYFPKQMIQKLASQLQGAEFTPDAASLVLGVDLPDYGQGGEGAPLPSDIKDLPSMVGGC